MIKLKIIAVFMVLVSVLLLLPACENNNPGNIIQGPTVTVTDCVGREVEVPENVKRIAALYSFAGYAVCLLGGGNDLVAVPDGLKRDKLLVQLFPGIADASVPRMGGAINVEELLRIKPDLVIVRKDTYADEGEVDKLSRTGIPYIVVDYTNMAEQREAIRIIGEAIGKPEKATEFNDYYIDVIERVTDIVGDIPAEDKISLYYSENQATRTTNAMSLSADWTKATGVINVSVGKDLALIDSDYYANIEQIVYWNPQVIIVNETTAYNVITKSEKWSQIDAVINGKVYHLPNGISRWGHPGSVETSLALLWTVKTVYPERSISISMEDEVCYFYKTFFDIELDSETIAEVLKGGELRAPK